MKNYFGIILSLFFACSLQAAAKPINTIVRGKVHNSGTQSISLYKVENGKPVKLGFRRPEKDGSFSFDMPLEKESIFFIGQGGGSKSGDLKYVLYLKPGDIAQLNLYVSRLAIEFDSCVINNKNEETVLLQQWNDLLIPLYKVGQNLKKRDNFIEMYNEIVTKAENFKKAVNTSNKYFNQLLKLKVDIDLDYARNAAFFFFNERLLVAYDTSISHRYFYKPALQKGKYCDAQLLNTEHGMSLLKYYTAIHRFFELNSIDEFKKTPKKNSAVTLICNDTLKGAVVMSYLPGIFTQEEFAQNIQPYEKYFLTASHKDAYNKKKKELMPFATGADAYNFSLTDLNDKVVTLKGLKGKVVVVDIWAMWCAPCLAQKPYFQKIEKEYESNAEIVFVSVSTDGVDRKEIWKNFVKKKGASSIELISNYTESIMKYYKVEGIPRFMIFDKKGKIITVNAPLPSDPAFKSLIEATLKSNS
jgi:thiol-disulfide isomerase/thioredoxin